MSDYEQWVLNGRALNDATFTLEQLSAPVPAKIAEWIRGADSEGAILARVPKHENRVIEMTLRVVKQASMDAALGKIGQIIDELQECAMNENGTALVWTPADASTVGPITFRCLMGEIVDLPIDWQDSGWLVYTPLIRIRLTCLPFGHGAEVSKGSVTSSDPLITLEVTGVAGDVPALGRLVVTDAASQSRRWLVWGLESRWYPTSSPPSLIVDSTSMVTTGYTGVTATRSGAYSGGSNNVIEATLRTQVQAICGLGNLAHIGQFRPQLRFYASALTMAVRLTYQTLDGPFRSLSYKVPVAVGWNHVDLGLVPIPQTTLGTQRWTGRIEAYSTAAGGETLDVDVVALLPAEQYGRAKASNAEITGVAGAAEGFTGSTDGAALDGRVATLGGTWVTSGSALQEFVTVDDIAPFLWGAGVAGQEVVRRTSGGSDTGVGRLAVLGSTTFTNTEVGVSFLATLDYVTGTNRVSVGTRFVDASNRLEASVVVPPDSANSGIFFVKEWVAGVGTVLALETGIAIRRYTIRDLRVVVFATGYGYADLRADGSIVQRVYFASSALATGGVLASGKPYLASYFDTTAGQALVEFDDFYAMALPAEDVVCNVGQSIEFRHDSTLREDATGTYAGPPPEYVGARFTVPCAGVAARKTRVAVMAKRNDVTTTADGTIADSTTAEVFVTPRYLAIPR